MVVIRRKRAGLKAATKYNRRKIRSRIYRRANKLGYFKLVRRLPEQFLQNATTAGIMTLSPSTIVNYGTPVATNFANYYNIGGSMSFKLNDLINPQDITNLFDKYKFRWVKIRLYCTSTTASVASTAQLPSIIWNVDEDDTTVPTPSFMREKMGSKQAMLYPGRPVTIFIKPLKMAQAAVNPASGTVGNTVVPAKYINSSYDAVPHFGLKFALQDVNLASSTTGGFTQFKWDITYCLEARDAQ